MGKGFSISRLKVIIALLFLWMIPFRLPAQIAFMTGGNYCNVRSEVILENKHSIAGYHWGVSLQYYPFRSLGNLSLINEFCFNHKGYVRDFEKSYYSRFSYASMPVLLNYSLCRFASVYSGIELSKLLSTNVIQGRRTYNNFDMGLVFGMSCFDTRRISFYSRITYGITPMLDYYRIDDLGNFTGEIHDLKNVCISVGFKLKLTHEKIRLYH